MVFNGGKLFKERLQKHIKELSRYLRYIFNEHLSIALLFTVVIVAIYYEEWISSLSNRFDSGLIVAFIFSLVVTYSPVRTLLERADVVFLVVAEEKMDDYFKYSRIYSYVTQLYILLISIAALAPLFRHANNGIVGSDYGLIVLFLFIYKWFMLMENWYMNQLGNNRSYQMFLLASFILNLSLLYSLIYKYYVIVIVLLLVSVIIFFYLRKRAKEATIAWESLIVLEQKKMRLFYRLANMFTEVPYLETSIKKRRLLSYFIRYIPYSHRRTFDYLYRITFIRSGDYLGMYVRLLVIGGLFVYFVPNEWLKLALGILFIYMSAFQMMSLFRHYRMKLWLEIYPVKESLQQAAVMKWIANLSVVQIIVYTLILLMSFYYRASFIMLVGGLIFLYLFMNYYVLKKFNEK